MEGLNPRSTRRTGLTVEEPEVRDHSDTCQARSSDSRTSFHDQEKVVLDSHSATEKKDHQKQVLTNSSEPEDGSVLENFTTPGDSGDTGGILSMDVIHKQFSSVMNKLQQKQVKCEETLQAVTHMEKEHTETIAIKDLEIKRLKSNVQYLKTKLRPRLKPEMLKSETGPDRLTGTEVCEITDIDVERTCEMKAPCIIDPRTNMPPSDNRNDNVLLHKMDNTAFIGKTSDNLEINSENIVNDWVESEDVCSCGKNIRKANVHETRICPDLLIEKQKNKSLNRRVAALEAKLILTEGDQTVNELKTEIIVLRQQMVVAVEDFEREKSERQSVVSSRNELHEKCAKLNSKIKALKYQLMLSTESLEEKVTLTSQLQLHIRRLSNDLKAKDEKIAELSERLFSTAGLSSQRGRPHPPDVAKQLLQNNYIAVENPFETESDMRWSCEGCTFLNSAARTVCDLCGNVRKFGDMATAHAASPNTKEHRTGGSTDARLCRLVSRGLSTDAS